MRNFVGSTGLLITELVQGKTNEAHLRWFILDDGCRGSGLGRKLIQEAMNFCEEQKFSAVQLWTFHNLY
nr:MULTISPECIES: GNAT family N-acetyltransferase [unclassified Citrobacter]